MNDIITTALLLTILGMVLGVANALLVFFTDWCMNKNNIFDWYYLFLLKHVQPKYPKLAKPLGLCPVCMGFWIGVGTFALFSLCIGIPVWVFIPFISVSSFVLIKLFKV